MKNLLTIKFFLLISLFLQETALADRVECDKRFFKGSDSFVCVCNSTYCDTLDQVDQANTETYFQEFVTSKSTHRLDKFKHQFQVFFYSLFKI